MEDKKCLLYGEQDLAADNFPTEVLLTRGQQEHRDGLVDNHVFDDLYVSLHKPGFQPGECKGCIKPRFVNWCANCEARTTDFVPTTIISVSFELFTALLGGLQRLLKSVCFKAVDSRALPSSSLSSLLNPGTPS